MAKYTTIPTDTFDTIQLNAGVLLSSFDPTTATVTKDNIIGATSGGVNFTATPSYTDFGEDIDNCPKNTKELKKLESLEVKLSGTFVTAKADTVKTLVGSADIDTKDSTHVIPRNSVDSADFQELWWVGDYSSKNGEKNGGYIAIHMKNVLNTSGFQIQSTDSAKGQFAFEFTAHFSVDNVNEVPYEIYIKSGEAE